MKIICDYKNKRFALENCGDKNAATCVAMLNDSVSVPQIINLDFKDIALELKDRQVKFFMTDGTDLKFAVQSAVSNMFEELGSAQIHCVVMLIAGECDLTFDKANEALQDIPQRLTDSIIFFGIKIDENLTGKNEVFLIVSD